MKHGDYLVDLIDEHGQIVDQKPRSQINKLVDRYHGVYVLIITPQGQLVLSDIAERRDLPNIYARTFGTTCAVIRRSSETASGAAQRALKNELLLDNPNCNLLGEGLVRLEDGRETFISAYSLVTEPPTKYSTMDIESLKLMSVDQFEEELSASPERFAPTLRAIWELYGASLRVAS